MKNILNAISSDVIYAAAIAQVEVVATLARKHKGNSLSIIDASQLIHQFNNDFNIDIRSVSISSNLLSFAVNLADKHLLRGYDAVQLASALEIYSRLSSIGVDFNLSPFNFVSADNELHTAAESKGLTVENPNIYP